MFEEETLPTLISRYSERWKIPLTKLIRETCLALASKEFERRLADGIELKPGWQNQLRRWAAIAERPRRDWGWWRNGIERQHLSFFLVKVADYEAWLRASGAVPSKCPGKRGPARDEVDRYGKKDRALFSEIDRRIEDGMSVHAATLELARQNKVDGTGTPESRAKRLAKRYRAEKKNR